MKKAPSLHCLYCIGEARDQTTDLNTEYQFAMTTKIVYVVLKLAENESKLF